MDGTGLPGDVVLPVVAGEDETSLRVSVAGIAGRYGPAYFQAVVDGGGTLDELWRDLAKDGHLGVHLPEAYGGGGGGLAQVAWVVEETAAAGVPVLSAVFSCGVNGTILARHGTEEQRRRWLPGLADGTALSSFALTEPDAGTNSFRTRTAARSEGDAWVLTGQKCYISGVDRADWVLVVARTGADEATGRGRLTLFLVDTDAPGLSVQHLPTALEIPEQQSMLFLDEVVVPGDRVVGEVGHGLRAAFAGMNAERLLVSAVCTGVGRYALDRAVEYARSRTVWSTPLGAHQALAHPLAEGKIELEAARWMTARALAMYDAGLDTGEYSNMAKVTGVDAGLRCLDAAI